MSILGTLGVVGATVGAAGSIAAGSEQAGAAKSAAQLSHEDQQAALAFQEKEWETQQQNIAPWLTAGRGAINTLSSLVSTPGQGLLTPWTDTFKAPTAAEAAATPGYQFQLGEGERELQNSAAASGGLLTGGTLKGITNYAEGLASTNYQNAFENALTQYQTAYNTFQNNQANTFNRLSAVAGGGQTAAAQLGQQGQQAAGNVGNIFLTGAGQQGAALQQGAAATASGYAGAANAFGGGISNLSSLLLLQKYLQQQSSPNANALAGGEYNGGEIPFTPFPEAALGLPPPP